MNQVTNLIQHKNLTQEQKDAFDFDNYDYVYQGKDDFWYTGTATGEYVHRLVIVDDKWYTRIDDDGQQITTLGEDIDITTIKYALSLRPAYPEEIPQDERTLERKIEDKWPDKEVVMFRWSSASIWGWTTGNKTEHIKAQSMRGFYKYVYEQDNDFITSLKPVKSWKGKTLQPVAVLFER